MPQDRAHARLSPSGAERWYNCPGSVRLEAEYPDKDSEASQYGTAAHSLAEMALTAGKPAAAYEGRRIDVSAVKTVEADAGMVDIVQEYLDYVEDVAIDGELYVEKRVDISGWVQDCFGTADAVVVKGDELHVTDLKTGYKPVNAVRNKQLALYALGCYDELSLVNDFKRIRLTVVQPKRYAGPLEWGCTVDELLHMGEDLKAKAIRAARYLDPEMPLDETDLHPTEEGCAFCKAKGTCPALKRTVEEIIGADFEELPDKIPPPPRVLENAKLAECMASVAIVENWCNAIRTEVSTRLLSGQRIPGYKLVKGRDGNRRWSDKDEVEKYLKSIRLKQEEMYRFELISPTVAEKLVKAGAIGPRQWPRLQELITRSEGEPSVAPENDKRPAIIVDPQDTDFDVLDDLEGLV